MKKILPIILFLCTITTILSGCDKQEIISIDNTTLNEKTNVSNMMIANPWSNCGTDFDCAKRVSNITFPLNLENISIRAMKDMIEINYIAQDNRKFVIRKSTKDFGGDISGVYTKYKTTKNIKLKNGVIVKIRKTKDKIYVMNMGAETGYYSIYCEQGMIEDDLWNFYEILRQAEEPKFLDMPESKYSKCELGDLVGDDVKRIKLYNYHIDYHSKDITKKEAEALAKECLLEGVGGQFEMDCCMSIKMFGEN